MDIATESKRSKRPQDRQVRILVRVSIMFFICAVIYSMIYLFIGKEPENAIVINTNSMATTTPIPVVRVESWTYNVAPIDITVEYPQLVHTASTTLETKMNTKFKNDAKKIYDETLKELKNASSDFVKNTETIPVSAGAMTASGAPVEPKVVVTYDRSVMFERKVQKDKTYINLDKNLVSILYTSYIDSGGAHGTFSYDAQILDTAVGKELTLKDFLQGEYAKTIVKDIDEQIRKADVTCIRCDDLADELKDLKVEVPNSFILDPNGITFLFGAYELGSYAATAGGQEVTVTRDTLSQYILREW